MIMDQIIAPEFWRKSLAADVGGHGSSSGILLKSNCSQKRWRSMFSIMDQIKSVKGAANLSYPSGDVLVVAAIWNCPHNIG